MVDLVMEHCNVYQCVILIDIEQNNTDLIYIVSVKKMNIELVDDLCETIL